jgi:hypothetical protein
MARWQLLKEGTSLRGVQGFYDTGKVFEADDPHGYLVTLQERDGCCYSAEPAQEGIGAGVARALKQLAGGVRF